MACRTRSIDTPPAELLPEHVRDAVAAAARQRAGGSPLTVADVHGLIELTAWAFNGVPQDDPRFEARLAEWTAHARGRALTAAGAVPARADVERDTDAPVGKAR
jgi:hypothetical protein